jgi:hypothetical protein
MKPSTSPLAPPFTANGYVGYMVRNTRTSGFKLALIVGPIAPTIYDDGSDRIRVRFWRAASACWTQPTLVERRYLQALTDEEKGDRKKIILQAGVKAAAQSVVNSWWI